MTDLCTAARAVERHEALSDALSDLVHAAAVALPLVKDRAAYAALSRAIEAAYTALAPTRGHRDSRIDRAGDAAAVFAAAHNVPFEQALVACNMD
jgi:hypothetical protein